LDGHRNSARAAERDRKLSIGALILSCLAVAIAAGLSSAPAYSEDGKADIVLRNGKIYTADKLRSIKQALAVTASKH